VEEQKSGAFELIAIASGRSSHFIAFLAAARSVALYSSPWHTISHLTNMTFCSTPIPVFDYDVHHLRSYPLVGLVNKARDSQFFT
jgi:hypothetical protein